MEDNPGHITAVMPQPPQQGANRLLEDNPDRRSQSSRSSEWML
jgi:hypothetical protein